MWAAAARAVSLRPSIHPFFYPWLEKVYLLVAEGLKVYPNRSQLVPSSSYPALP